MTGTAGGRTNGQCGRDRGGDQIDFFSGNISPTGQWSDDEWSLLQITIPSAQPDRHRGTQDSPIDIDNTGNSGATPATSPQRHDTSLVQLDESYLNKLFDPTNPNEIPGESFFIDSGIEQLLLEDLQIHLQSNRPGLQGETGTHENRHDDDIDGTPRGSERPRDRSLSMAPRKKDVATLPDRRHRSRCPKDVPEKIEGSLSKKKVVLRQQGEKATSTEKRNTARNGGHQSNGDGVGKRRPGTTESAELWDSIWTFVIHGKRLKLLHNTKVNFAYIVHGTGTDQEHVHIIITSLQSNCWRSVDSIAITFGLNETQITVCKGTLIQVRNPGKYAMYLSHCGINGRWT